MDNLVQTLRQIAETEDPTIGWEISNNANVIRIKATSLAQFGTADLAFAEARRIAETLVGDGSHKLVNSADIGASSRPVGDGKDTWRGTIDVLVWPASDLQGYHDVIDLG
jgi:hypothetical protein